MTDTNREHVWVVFRTTGSVDMVFADLAPAQEYADDLGVRGIDTMIEPYELHFTAPGAGSARSPWWT